MLSVPPPCSPTRTTPPDMGSITLPYGMVRVPQTKGFARLTPNPEQSLLRVVVRVGIHQRVADGHATIISDWIG